MILFTVIVDGGKLPLVVVDGLNEDFGGSAGIDEGAVEALEVGLALRGQGVVADEGGAGDFQAPLEHEPEHGTDSTLIIITMEN